MRWVEDLHLCEELEGVLSLDVHLGVDDMKFAKRMSLLGTETAFEVMAKAKALEAQGKDMIYLQIGEPDFPTPKHIIEAGVAALRGGQTHYCASSGILPLKEAIVKEVVSRRGVAPSLHNIVVTPGAKPILFFVILAMIEAGDEVIFPVMGFPLYVKIALQLDLKPKYVDVEEKHLTIDVNQLEKSITSNTKGIVVTHLFGYPCNMDKVMEIANKNGIPVIEDCAQSYDSFYKGQETGTFGYAGIFSCSLMKVPTTLGGGILLTEDEELVNILFIKSIKPKKKKYAKAAEPDFDL